MTEPKKFRFPIIELLSLSVIVLGAVIVLWPSGEKYVYKLVTGKELNEGGELLEETLTKTRPNLVYAPTAPTDDTSITQKIAAEIHSLPNLANNEFPTHAQHAARSPAEISGEIQGVISSDNSFEAPRYRAQPNETPLALPADSVVDNSTLDEPLLIEESFDPTSQHSIPDLPAPDTDIQFMEPPMDPNTAGQFEEDQFVELGLPDAQDFPMETELTSPLDAAPEQAPINQINLELDNDYSRNTSPDLTPPALVVETNELPNESVVTQNQSSEMPKVRQLPVWEPTPMRVVNGSLTPMTTPRPSPSNGWQKEISDEGAVVWKSNVAAQQELPANELAPTEKQVVAPRIQTANLPPLPKQAAPLFLGGIIPEHVPGAKRKMMSDSMQSENDFELPSSSSSSTEYSFSGLPQQEQQQEPPVSAGGQLPPVPAPVFQRQNPLR